MDEKREAPGTKAGAQMAEFLDTPENEPGDQEHPPPDTTGLGTRPPADAD